MIGIFVPFAWSDISKETAQSLTFVGMGFVGIGLVLAVWKYFKNPVEKKLRIYGIITVLDRMYKRLEALVGRESDKEIDWDRYRETADKINRFAGVAVPVVSSIDEARDKVESFEKEIPSILPMNRKREQRIVWVHSVSRLLDKDGFGLKDVRKRDGKYNHLLKMLDRFYDDYKDTVDDELRRLIRSCVDFTESATNALLFMRRMDTTLALASDIGIPNLLTPSLEADMEGFNDEIREIARMLRVEVGESIKRLVC